MRAADFFAAVEQLPTASLQEITCGGGVVVVAPHPDDESLGCAGLIAEACAQGVVVRLIVVSDGVGSHPKSKVYPPAKLRALREEETRAAAEALGLPQDAIRFLRLPDTKVPLDGAQADAATETIVETARDCDARVLCVTWRRDPHCDHVAAAALANRARAKLPDIRILSYPIWGRALPPDVEVGSAPCGVRFPMARHLPAKTQAIASHRSQTTDLISDDPEGFRLTPDMIARFHEPFEIFLDTDMELTQ
jgi:LmbE family N-acetylglucosaminyl deacetylase